MDRINQTATMEDIMAFVREVARRFKPQKIILFGSFGYGRPKQGSDVDILVIMNTRLRPVEQAIEIRKSLRAPFPMDLLVRTPQQIEERVLLGDFFIKELVEKGKVVYEAGD